MAAEVPGPFSYARTIAADGQLAEDLVQDTLLRALQRAESFRGDASLATWLHRILHNLAVDRFRRDREDATEDVEREVEERWRDDSYTVDAATVGERAETREELEDALVRLPVIYRTVVVLHDAEGMTVAEIAVVQGVGLPAAKQRLRRGRMTPAVCSAPDGCLAAPSRVWATRDTRGCVRLSGALASAPREPPDGRLLGWAAGASLRGGNSGHDRVDVHAAAAPGGLSATVATGWTTHTGFSSWLILK
jgi:RNA polymerase sigma-70 factor (ECF subfamily)